MVLRLGRCVERNLNWALNLSDALIDASFVSGLPLSNFSGNPIYLRTVPIAASNFWGRLGGSKYLSERQPSK